MQLMENKVLKGVFIRLSHLWSNMFFQLILGVLLEIVHHWKRILIIYLASILGGSLFITVLNPQSYAVGASAGVYGLLFSHLSTIILNWNEMDRKCCRLFWLLFYILFDVGFSFCIEGIRQAQLLTKSTVIEGLPSNVEQAIDSLKIPARSDAFMQDVVRTSFLFDAQQEKLAIRKVPDRPAYVLPRDYGITEFRRNTFLNSGMNPYGNHSMGNEGKSTYPYVSHLGLEVSRVH